MTVWFCTQKKAARMGRLFGKELFAYSDFVGRQELVHADFFQVPEMG